MTYKNRYFIVLSFLIVGIVYAVASTKSKQFAKFTSVLNANIDNVSFIVVVLMASLYLLRIYGITTETFKVCNIDETDTTQQEKHEYCLNLPSGTCTASTCCILLDGNKCVGRTGNSPTYHSNGETKVSFDYSEWKDVHGDLNCIGCSE